MKLFTARVIDAKIFSKPAGIGQQNEFDFLVTTCLKNFCQLDDRNRFLNLKVGCQNGVDEHLKLFEITFRQSLIHFRVRSFENSSFNPRRFSEYDASTIAGGKLFLVRREKFSSTVKFITSASR